MVKRCCPTCASEADSGECHQCNPDRWLALRRGVNFFKVTSPNGKWKHWEYRCLEIWKPQTVDVNFINLSSTTRLYSVNDKGHYSEMKLPKSFKVERLEHFREVLARNLFIQHMTVELERTK